MLLFLLSDVVFFVVFFFFKQKTAYEMRISDWSSDVCSSDLRVRPAAQWQPEVASLNMGSMNFGLFPMLKRYKDFKHDWEPAMLEIGRASCRERVCQYV